MVPAAELDGPGHAAGRPAAWRVLRAALFDLLLALVVFIAVALVAGVFALTLGLPEGGDAGAAALPATMAIAMALAAWLPYLLRRQATRGEVAAAHAALLRPSTWGWIVATLVALLALGWGLEWLDAWFALELEASNEQPIAEMLEAEPALTAVYVLLLAPVFEELLFRRVLFGRFLEAGRPLLGYAVTGVAFASLHEFAGLSPGGWLQTSLLWSFYFAMAVALAWVYRRTGSLWAPVLVHAGNNALALWAFGI
jgi:membrane protease YdiL (CAAX protease family)